MDSIGPYRKLVICGANLRSASVYIDLGGRIRCAIRDPIALFVYEDIAGVCGSH